MATEIKNAVISFVSLVDKGANGKKFAIIKSDNTKQDKKQIEKAVDDLLAPIYKRLEVAEKKPQVQKQSGYMRFFE